MCVFNLDRFITAQDRFEQYETALNEVKNGRKESRGLDAMLLI